MATVFNNINLQLFSELDTGYHYDLDEDTIKRLDLLIAMRSSDLEAKRSITSVASLTELDRIATAQEKTALALSKVVSVNIRIADALECIAKHMEPGNA